MKAKHLILLLLTIACLLVFAGCSSDDDDCDDGCTLPADGAEQQVVMKPVIYLYPQEATDISVSLDYAGEITTTYPEYKGSWKVNAKPDGTLTDANGQTYKYLYWEGTDNIDYDMSEGFCIKGSNTAAFLEEALAELGLTREEANEFIVFWLPMMEKNEYNVISFQNETYTDNARLNVSPEPDTQLRVFMTWYGSTSKVRLPRQQLKKNDRKGFVLVEWGGCQVEGR